MTLHGKDCHCEFCSSARSKTNKTITLTRAQLSRQLDKAYAEGQRRGEEATSGDAA